LLAGAREAAAALFPHDRAISSLLLLQRQAAVSEASRDRDEGERIAALADEKEIGYLLTFAVDRDWR